MENLIAEKFRCLAGNLDYPIECKFASRTENTPKQQRQAGEARLEGNKLKRTQEALYILSELHKNEEVPKLLVGFTSKKKIYDAMSPEFEKGNHGYYDISLALDKPRQATPPDNYIMYWVRCAGRNVNVIALNKACAAVAADRGLI